MRKNISGERIKFLREEKGLTQKQLAEEMHPFGWRATSKKIARIEEGLCKVRDVELVLFRTVLNTTIEFLLRGNESEL